MKQRQMTLGNQIKRSVRQGRLMPAIVTDIFNGRGNVRLGMKGNGAAYHNLLIIGGPIKAGDSVNIDFTTPDPTIVAQGVEGLSQNDLDNAIKSLANTGISGIPTLKICQFSGGSLANLFEPSSEGLTLALTGALAGDVIWLPDTDITADIEIPAGVILSGISSRQSIVRGTAIVHDDSGIENVKIVATAWSPNDIYAIDCQSLTRPAWIRNAEIHSYHCAIGNSYAIQMSVNSLLEVDQAAIISASGSGDSYAFKGATDSYAKVTHSRLFGITDWFDATGNFDVYSNVEGSSELEWWCVVDPFYRYSSGSGADIQGMSDYYFTKVIQRPSTPTSVTMLSEASGSYPGTVARMNDYIYLSKQTGTILEFNISDGNSSELVVNATGQVVFVVVENQRLLAYSPGEASHTIKLVDFESQAISTLREFPEEDGDFETENTDSFGSPEYGMAITQDNGDIIVVFVGRMNRYYVDADWSSSAGVYFLVKNWTQDGDWNLVKDVLKPTSNFYEDIINLYVHPVAVKNRYVTLIPSWNIASAIDYPDGLPAHGDLAYKCMVVLDLNDNSLTVTRSSFARGIASYPDPDWFWIGVDHENMVVFSHYYPEAGGLQINKFDPVAETIGTHQTLSTPTDVVYMFNKSNCYYMHCVALGNADIYVANTNVKVLDNWNMPHYLYKEMDWVMDDNNNRFWYFNKDTGAIVSVNPETGAQSSFASGVTPAVGLSGQNWLFALGNTFVIFVNKTAGNMYVHYLVKE